MLTHWQSHKEFLFFLHEQKIYFDPSLKLRLQTEYASFREKLVLLNIDKAMAFLQQLYPPLGRPAKNQTQIFRSLILFLLASKSRSSSGLSAWVQRLKSDPVLAALVGCTTDSLPPLGSYFDFMNRLWLAPVSDRYSRNKLFSLHKNDKKPLIPSRKNQKAKESRKGISSKIAHRLMDGRDIPGNFEALLQQLLLITVVRPSVQLGLIPRDNLTISGDGTCLHTHSFPPGRKTDIPSLRHFSDPDADWGWDSDLEQYFFGYTLYPLSFYNKEERLDLPLFFRITSARRHDSINFLVAFHEFCKYAPDIPVKNICLDSAHDNYGTYELLAQRQIIPFIDLNPQHGYPQGVPESLRVDAKGAPLCQAGYSMTYWGYDKSQHAHKWRCPYKTGKVKNCDCICSASHYGRTVHTKPDWDIRLYPPVLRQTSQWKETYKNRSSSERINNRILNDYGLHSMLIHTKKHYSFMTMAICICIHLDAWYKKRHRMNL